MTEAKRTSTSNDYGTPSRIVEPAAELLGGIDLDPASCPLANETVGARRIIALPADGLAEPWSGTVFLNPPGGRAPAGSRCRSMAALWWAKLAEEWLTGRVTAAIFVGFTLEILRTTQGIKVPQPLVFPMCVPARRIAFDALADGTRQPTGHPAHPNVIVYLPPQRSLGSAAAREAATADVAHFVELFSPIGQCRR